MTEEAGCTETSVFVYHNSRCHAPYRDTRTSHTNSLDQRQNLGRRSNTINSLFVIYVTTLSVYKVYVNILLEELRKTMKIPKTGGVVAQNRAIRFTPISL
jgi:hypothetical protein